MSSKHKFLDYFSKTKKSSEPPIKKFLSDRIAEETGQIVTHKAKCATTNCESCLKKDKEIDELKQNIKKLETENKKLVKDNTHLKHVLTHSNRINLQKDLKIEELEKESKEQSGPVLVELSDKTVFSQFADIFSQEELSALRSIPSSSSKDSTFVLQTIRYLYKENLSVLSSRTSSSSRENKKPISPEKKNIIQQIFHERLNILKLDIIECNSRKNRLNELTATGINNVRKSFKRQSLERNS